MNILFVASECAPLAKVGGLADVVGALPKALKKIGVDVRIVLPKYNVMDENKFPSRKIASLTIPFNETTQSITVRETRLPNSEVPLYLLDHPNYFGNGGVYIESDASSGGSSAELNRFALFARAIPDLIDTLEWQPDLIHCHDWQTGSLPAILKSIGQQTTKTLFTIHNLAYQGIHPRRVVERALGKEIIGLLAPHPHNSNEVNFLATALEYADRISTVSPSYAQEITTHEFGCGLEHVLQRITPSLVGITNGIDTDYWNPATDQWLSVHYTADNAPAAQIKLKQILQHQTRLPEKEGVPLFVMVSRLTNQKGFDILLPALETTMPAHDFQCVILASGDKEYAAQLRALEKRFPHKLHFAERFDEPLAHLMYAAGDFFLMPSHFEPCGLGQLIAMRYGTIPLATAVGGLRDTVKDEETGFIISAYTCDALMATITRALAYYHERPTTLQTMRRNGMTVDHSWTHAAKEYVTLYQEIMSNNQTPRNK